MKALLIAVIVVSTLDVTTTCVGLNRGGFREVNPLYGKQPSCGRVVAVNAAIVVPAVYFARKSNTKSTRWMLGIVIGVRSVAVTWNVVQLAKHKGDR